MSRLPGLPALPLPAAGWPLILLLGAFLVVGSVGHDPWKVEDASHFGVVWRALGSADWLDLRFAYASVVEPPLYYWLAGGIGRVLAPLLGWPDAVRLASPLFAGITCALLFFAARELHGRDAAGAAPLALAGCLGFLVQSHETQPLLAATAGIAATYAGTVLAWRRPLPGAGLIGSGLGATVLAHGVTLLPALLLTVLAGAAVAPERRRSLAAAVGGLGLAAALAGPWLWALDATSAATLGQWWTGEMTQFGVVVAPGANAATLAKLLLWFAWPALPLALWALWVERHRLGDATRLLPLIAFLAMAADLALVFPARGVIALALLPALALLAIPGLLALRRGAANAFDWFGRMTFTLLGGLIWLGWVAMNFGLPEKIARNFAKLAPGFTAVADPLAIAAAVIASLLWLWLVGVRAASPSPLRPLAHWAGGMTLLWVLTICLWLPWIEHGRSYRSIAAAVDARIPASNACVSVRNVGEGQLASLDYFLARRLQFENAGKSTCRWLLVQGTAPERAPGGGWVKAWEGGRPGDRNERFRLYRRR